jgi:hypothetical protein
MVFLCQVRVTDGDIYDKIPGNVADISHGISRKTFLLSSFHVLDISKIKFFSSVQTDQIRTENI